MAESPVNPGEHEAPEGGDAVGAEASVDSSARALSERVRAKLKSLERGPLRRRDRFAIPVLLGAMAVLAIGMSRWIGGAPIADYDGALDTVAQMLRNQSYDEALAYLNDPIAVSMPREPITPAQLARFYALSADVILMGQAAKGIDVRANHQRAIDLYALADDTDPAVMTADRRSRYAGSLIAVQSYVTAYEELSRIPETSGGLGHERLRDLIESVRDEPNADLVGSLTVASLLNELREKPTVSAELYQWTVEEQTAMRLRAGYPERAVEALLPEIQRLETRFGSRAGRLFVLLGRAYMDLGHLDDAQAQLEHATHPDVLSEQDEKWGEAKVFLGRIAQIRDDPELARDLYLRVAERFPQTPVAVASLVGLGEVESTLGDAGASLGHYQLAVEKIRQPGMQRLVDYAELRASLEQRHRDRYTRGEYLRALQYAQLIESLFGESSTPTEAIERIARTHKAYAAEVMERIPLTPSGEVDLDAADPISLEEARSHFFSAGRYFERVAEAMKLGDPGVYAEAVWEAGDSYDRASAEPEAIAMFTEYVAVRDADPRSLEAMLRLGKTHMAEGNYDLAIRMFERLRAEHPRSKPAADSAVPLAQAYLYESEDARWLESEELLLRVLAGGQDDVTPESRDYRTALIELGLMYQRVGEYTQAIERIDEAIRRYEDLDSEPRVVFALGDAHRMSAFDIAEQLKGGMPQSERFKLNELRLQRLVQAEELYDRVRVMLMGKDPRRLTDLDKVMLRNAMFYRGDCVYDVAQYHDGNDPAQAKAQYERAIELYDTAAQRYSREPSSLVAMTQIVNCYLALGQVRQAQTAHERAKSRLSQLSEDAWEGERVPMTRRHWEEWLRSSVALDARAAAANP